MDNDDLSVSDVSEFLQGHQTSGDTTDRDHLPLNNDCSTVCFPIN